MATKVKDWREHTHPDLLGLTDAEFTKRTSFWPRLFFVKHADWINWYGGAIRDLSTGRHGMYMTEAQYALWPHKVGGDITIGPR